MAEIRIGSCQILDEVSQNWFGRSYKRLTGTKIGMYF
jgi:hypothetical protein